MTDDLEFMRIGVSALTPIVTGIVGALILRMGTRMEHSKNLHRELLRKRLTLFEDVAPKLNDIYCYFQALGHWSDLNPDEIILRKRSINSAFHVNRFLFDQAVWSAYQQFEKMHFDMYAAAGQPAKLRLDIDYIRLRVGELFKNEWATGLSQKGGDREAQKGADQSLMDALGRSIVISG